VTIGDYFSGKYNTDQTEQVALKDGTTVTGARAEDTDTILLFDDEGNIIGLKDGEKLIYGDLAVDGQGKMALLNGYIDGTYVPELGITMDIENGYATNARIVAPLTGDTLYWVRHREDGGNIYYNSHGEYVDARITGFDGYEVSLYDGLTDDFYVPNYFNISDDDLEVFLQYGIRGEDVRGAQYGFRINSNGEYEEFLEPLISYSTGSSAVFGDDITAEYLTSDTFKTKTEIVKNFHKGYGVVTDAELLAIAQNEYKIIIDNAQEGDRIFFSGETPIDMAIKAFEFGKGNGGVIMNHEGVVTVINGKKYVYEVQPEGKNEVLGGNALKLVPLEKALARYVTIDAQGNVTKVNGIFKVVRPDDIVKSGVASGS